MFFSNLLKIDEFQNCYDLRSEHFSNEDALLLGKGFGTELVIQNKQNVCIGFDRRKLSNDLCNFFIKGILSIGIDVFELGQFGTPVIQYTAIKKGLDAAVSITASHNPIVYHGFKFFIDSKPFSGVALQKLILRCLEKKFDYCEDGKLTSITPEEYIEDLSKIEIEGKFRVCWDLLNGCGGDILPKMKLKGHNQIINCEKIEGFGNYPPDPSCIERLNEILELEKSNKIDFGFLVDGDADRISLLYKGELINGDVFLAMIIYLQNFITGHKIKVGWDTVSSLTLQRWAASFSEEYIGKTGHSNMQALCIQSDIFVAGELSGHYFFKDWHYIDDGLYTGLFFLSCLEKANITLDELFEALPKIFVKKYPSVKCRDYNDKIEKLDILKKYLKDSGIVYVKTDGIQMFSKLGLVKIRPSNTEHVLRIMVESWDENSFILILDFVKDLIKLI